MTQDHAAERELLARLRIEDGVAYWRESPGRRAAAGSRAGSVLPKGYVIINYRGRTFQLHRLVFLAHHGHLPALVDHKDGNPANNHIDNLRAATRTQNQWNAKRRKDNTSGVKNVCWNKKSRRWGVRLYINGYTISLGGFTTLGEAAAVAEQARRETYGEFARDA
tara:strand:+ start:361 stop:855 length:495 start_codon:yes stop_codon:yes gene_type:complete